MRNHKLQGESNTRFLSATTEYRVGAVLANVLPGYSCQLVQMQNGRGGAYGVLEITNARTRKTEHIALVIAMTVRKGFVTAIAKTELDGPLLANMPEALLNVLTPLDPWLFSPEQTQHSNSWRAKCQKAVGNRKILVPGLRFRVMEPLAFGIGRNCFEFEVINVEDRLFMCNPGTATASRARFTPAQVDTLNFTVHPDMRYW